MGFKTKFSAFSKKSEVDGEIKNLDNYNLKPLYIPFASSANRVLIDYKKFK